MTTVMVGAGHVVPSLSAQHAQLFVSLDLGLRTTLQNSVRMLQHGPHSSSRRGVQQGMSPLYISWCEDWRIGRLCGTAASIPMCWSWRKYTTSIECRAYP
jgi:hypothetical protein